MTAEMKKSYSALFVRPTSVTWKTSLQVRCCFFFNRLFLLLLPSDLKVLFCFLLLGSFVHRRFSQMELSKKNVVYIINPEKDSLSDSLEFTVSDPLGNTGTSHV